METGSDPAAVSPSELIRAFAARLEAARQAGEGVKKELTAMLALGPVRPWRVERH